MIRLVGQLLLELGQARDGLVDAASPVGELEADGVPFGFEPTRSDTELGPTARHDVERGDGAGNDERMTKSDVVDVRSEPDPFGAARKVREIGEGIEDGNVGGYRRVLFTRVGTPVGSHRKDQMLLFCTSHIDCPLPNHWQAYLSGN